MKLPPCPSESASIVPLCAPELEPTTVTWPIWLAGMPLNVIWVWGSALFVFGLGNTATAGWASAAGAAASSADAATSAITTPRVTPDHRRDLNCLETSCNQS